MTSPPTLYLAGPDVFHPEALAIGRAKTGLCAARGFTGLFPLDGGAPEPSSAAIFARCMAMMAHAEAGIFNLTPFRGVSADVGTVFELGVMVAAGKPVFAYSNEARDLLDRLRASGTLVRRDAVWRDAAGLMVEDFGNADNLMLDEALAAQGRRTHRLAVPEAERFTDLAGFEACLAEAAALLTAAS